MAKAKPCILIGNTSWGYCLTPQEYPSIYSAKKAAREMIKDGLWAYRIRVKKVTLTKCAGSRPSGGAK